MRMRHHPLGIEKLLDPQAVAFRTGPDRVVEGEQAWLQFAQAVTTHRTGKAGGKQPLGLLRLVQERHPRHALGQSQRGLERFRQPQAEIGADLKTVHHDFNGVLAAQIQRRRAVQLHHLAVDAGAHETLFETRH
jgi:hypothetical protein